jgi:hypothetical protein
MEMGRVIMSCGHQCYVRPVFGFPVILKSEGIDIEAKGVCREVIYSTYCWECYKTLVCDYPEDMLFDEHEVEEYLNG